MKIFILLSIFLCSFINAISQIGINTELPKATLDVAASVNNISMADGIIAPRLTGTQLQSKNSIYTTDQTGAIVYVTSASPKANVSGDKTTNVTAAGYYFFNGTEWIPYSTASENGLTTTNNTISLGGKLTKPTVISGISNSNSLSFTATGTNAININDTTLSLDGANSRIGFGTKTPVRTVDIEGSLRLSPSFSGNSPTTLDTSNKPVYGNTSTGAVRFSPDGYTKVVGGFRPGSNVNLNKFPTNNTLARVRFVCYIHRSSDENNSQLEPYTYGDFAIIGTGTSDKIKFIDVNIKGATGTAKSLLTNTGTQISWSNYSQGNTLLSLDQTTGWLNIKTTSGNANISTLTYFFEILGGV